jgi:hypothetical protein
MSVNGGPNIVEDGLVLALDAANIKSFRGEPTTNLISNANTMASWTNYYRTLASSTFTTEFGTTGYRFVNQPTWNGIYRTFNLVNSGTYTFSAWIRYNGGSASNNGAQVYVSNYGAGDTATGINKNLIGIWQRISKTVNVTSPTNVYFYLISYGGVNNGTNDPDFSSWEVTMPQIEAKSYPTSFVNGTRGTTVATGGGWADRSGNSNHGELVNGPTYSSNGLGALVFDGVNDYIKSTLVSSLGTQFTIHSWFKKNNNNVGNLFNFQGSPSFELLVDQTNRLNIWDGADHFYNFTTIPGSYYYMSVVKTATNFLLYVNNNSTPVLNFNSSYNNSNTNFIVGCHPNLSTGFLNGNITQVQIYNRALSASEVLQNYNATKGRFGL